MKEYKILKISSNPELKYISAEWFHSKWKIPFEVYLKSMNESLSNKNIVPEWYIVMYKDSIIAGAGVIENDFHNRKDLSPNVCAVYVEKEYRNQGIAKKMLKFICDDMAKQGINILYLITDHTSFYQKCGWQFLCMVQEDDSSNMTKMYIHNTM